VIVVLIHILIRRIQISIKTEIKCVAVDWYQLAQDWSYGGHTLNNMPSDLEYEEFLHPLYNCQFRKRKSFLQLDLQTISHRFLEGD
jgi:hypothetical protein